jgi:hypothetical protein
MGSPAFVARLQIKRRWRSLVAVALFVAIVGGLATALIAGARRSSSVVHRYFAATIPYNVLVGGYPLERSQLLALPGVERVDRDMYFASTYVTPDGTLGDAVNGRIYDPSAIDPTFRVLDGEVPRGDDASSVLVNDVSVRQFGLRAGDRLTVKTFAPSDLADVEANHYDTPHGPDYRFRIAAVIRTPDDIALDQPRTPDRASANTSAGGMWVPSAFYDANHTSFLGFGDAFDVQLTRRTSTREFQAAAKRSLGNIVYFGPPRFAERRDSFDTPVDLETSGLLALGIATALAGAIVVALLLDAEARAHEDPHPAPRCAARLGYECTSRRPRAHLAGRGARPRDHRDRATTRAGAGRVRVADVRARARRRCERDDPVGGAAGDTRFDHRRRARRRRSRATRPPSDCERAAARGVTPAVP